MPTKALPAKPSLQHLKAQAKDLLAAHRAQALDANQRLREFHPQLRGSSDHAHATASLKLSDAQLTIAREYGFASWSRLKKFIEAPQREDLRAPAHERIADPLFRAAVDLLDSGNAAGLKEHLREYPAIIQQRQNFVGGNYFSNPALLEFIAENPTRHGTLPANILDVAKVILEAGGKRDRASLDATLGLVASSLVARKCAVQLPLIDLLCEYGADANSAVLPSLIYGEFDAVNALLRHGARMSLVIAAATGRLDEARAHIKSSDEESVQIALALAAQYGHTGIVALLLESGADPDQYSPVGTHSHATPLHQAALAGHERVVRLLVERGARRDIKDILHNATPAGWAEYAGHPEIAGYLSEE